MTIEQILTGVHLYHLRLGRPPRSYEPEMQAYAKEGQRKIGSWRMVLWLAGALEEHRRVPLAPCRFQRYGTVCRVDRASLERVRTFFRRPYRRT